MKIGIVTTHLPPVMGGIEVHCHNLAHSVAARGHAVTLYGSLEADQDATFRESPSGSNPRIRRVPAWFTAGMKRPSRAFNLLRLLLEEHRDEPFDVLHAHQIFPVGIVVAEASRLLGTRFVITEHGSILDDSGVAWKRPLLRRACNQAACILTASRELAEVVVKTGADPSRVQSRPNAVPVEEFEMAQGRAEARRALGLPADAFIAMTVRRLVPKTGVQYAVKALARCVERLPNLQLVIVGDGPLRQEIAAMAEEAGVSDHVTFVGAVDNSEVPRFMRAADLGLFPSLAEATSIAALEFMSLGIPVLATTVGGLPEIINDGVTGYLVDFGFTLSRYDDPGLPETAIQNLADGLVRAANADLSAIGAAAAVTVRERYSWTRYAEYLDEMIYRVSP